MVLRSAEDAMIAIGQPAHAWLSGQLARAWGNAAFGAVEPWEEVCLAAEQHDIGMADADAAPQLNRETGLPRSFMELALDDHLEMWTRAPQRVIPQSRYAAALVSMHGVALYELRDLERMAAADADRVRSYMLVQRALQEALLATVDAQARALAPRNQRLVWTWDFLSLALLLDWAPCAVEDVPTADGGATVELRLQGDALTLDPWPFAAESVRVRTEGRRLAGGYVDEAELHAALARAEWVTVAFELRAPGRPADSAR